MRGRTRLAFVAVLWLASHAAALAVSPFAMCCDHAGAAMTDGHACCAGMAPGDMCPMHEPGAAAAGTRSAPDADGPVLRCFCRASDAALAAMLLGHGILPADFVLPFAPVASAVSVPDAAAQGFAAALDPPPPRA